MQFEWLASLKAADKVLSLRYDKHVLGSNRGRLVLGGLGAHPELIS